MKSLEGFIHAQQDEELSVATTYTPSFIGLSQRHGLWVDSFMGQGVIIGEIDDGIYPNHSSFKDSTVDTPMPPPPMKWKGKCQFRRKHYCNNKLIGAIAFQRGQSPPPRVPKKDGHGTHCAGIATGSMVLDADVRGLAKGTASGVAPRAHLAIYQAWITTSCKESDILKAMDQAIIDGVDVLSISLYNVPRPFYRDLMVIGAFSATRKGLVVCLVAANLGPEDSSIWNDEPWAITVGASSHDRKAKATVKLGDGTEIDGETGYQDNNFNATLPLIFPGLLHNGTNGCRNDSFNNVDVKGKIVLCYIVEGKFTDMGVHVKKAGGAAMIVTSTFVEGFTTFSDVHVLPAAHVDDQGLQKIANFIKSVPNPNATITFGGTIFGKRPSPTIPYFSSRGSSMLNGGILKPDIVGPGVNILSAWPFKPGPGPKSTSGSYFNFLSETSMATPHLARVAALLKSTHKNWSPAAIKSAIMTTADRLDLDLKPIIDDFTDDFNSTGREPANLFALGAGQVNPQAANDPGLIYDLKPFNYIQYLCGLGYNDVNVSTIAKRQIQCANLVKINAENLNYPSISVTLDPKVKKNITRVLTNVVNGGTEVYHTMVEKPKGIISINVSPQKLRFSKLDQKRKFTVEFEVTGIPLSQGETVEGQLLWRSTKHEVRSPILITFA
ncbi:Peptidase S8 subtilisin-related protein [Dioscorea alata]|uniref:Peptidase S8 subtilisin-related protein n=1 Tax=Dioscorea alata TaxID=55571 RepID=A0ACB7UYC7_DIOAL|nr:Peptidase S8 subtilisin-related protein [Dioscorea alata]